MPLPQLSALVADASVAEATRLVEQDGSLASELSWESLTPLHWACTGPGSPELCTVLLRAGADANAANTWGSTPLHYAAYGNHLECVRVLLEGGARVDVVDQDGRTPRQDAEGRGHLQVVDLLRERGGSGGSGDLIGFGDGAGSAPPVVVAPPGDAAKEKWQEAQKKVTLMKAAVTAFQSSAPEAAGEDEKAVPPPAVGNQPPEPVDLGEAAKQRGNEAMKSEKYNQAVSHYTEALRMAPTNHVYYSNRSLAYGKSKSWEEALRDAQKCIELQPSWSKGFTRKASALAGAGRTAEAMVAYESAMERAETADLKEELQKRLTELSKGL